jgi:hypothetical protein
LGLSQEQVDNEASPGKKVSAVMDEEFIKKLKSLGKVTVPRVFGLSVNMANILADEKETFLRNMDAFLLQELHNENPLDNLQHLSYLLHKADLTFVHFSMFLFFCIEVVFNPDARRFLFKKHTWTESRHFCPTQQADVNLFLLTIEIALEMYLGVNLTPVLNAQNLSTADTTNVSISDITIINPNDIVKLHYRTSVREYLKCTDDTDYFNNVILSDDDFVRFISTTLTCRELLADNAGLRDVLAHHAHHKNDATPFMWRKSWMLLNKKNNTWEVDQINAHENRLFITHIGQ